MHGRGVRGAPVRRALLLLVAVIAQAVEQLAALLGKAAAEEVLS